MPKEPQEQKRPGDVIGAAAMVARIASGEYATDSDGLRALQARDKAVDHWLRNEAIPAYGASKADPSRGATLADVRAAMAERHAAI